jgi:hypothetical protein
MSLSLSVIRVNCLNIPQESLHGICVLNGVGCCIEKIKNFMKGFCLGVVDGALLYSQIFLDNFYTGLGLSAGLLTGFILFMEIFRKCTST